MKKIKETDRKRIKRMRMCTELELNEVCGMEEVKKKGEGKG